MDLSDKLLLQDELERELESFPRDDANDIQAALMGASTHVMAILEAQRRGNKEEERTARHQAALRLAVILPLCLKLDPQGGYELFDRLSTAAGLELSIGLDREVFTESPKLGSVKTLSRRFHQKVARALGKFL